MKNVFLGNTLRRSIPVVAALAIAAIVAPAHADNLVTNGSFSATTGAATGQIAPNGTPSAGEPVGLTGWTTNTSGGTVNAPYNFVFNSSTTNVGQDGSLSLIGQSQIASSDPDGGNFVGLDDNYQQGALQQTISNLIVGATYTLTFDFAGAQQSGFSGATQDQILVTFGSQSASTQVLNDPSGGFTGWNSETMTFTATSASQTLSFLADGTPGGEPPFALIDGVNLSSPTSATPEPSSLALLATGLFGVGGMMRSRFKKITA
jgi:hypothetical protein